MNKQNYLVIMAGGVGSRFWPVSKVSKPKQFLDFFGTGKTLIQQTYDRFSGIITNENIFVVTNKEHVDLVKEQLPQLNPQNIIAEPMRRNTAPCILYASLKIAAKDPWANVVVTPADHLILDNRKFEEIIKEGLKYTAGNNVLLTLGIQPDRPATTYGYIQVSAKENNEKIIKAKAFTEKPHLELARVFLQSGEFLWNSGIFIWKNKVIIEEIQKFLPELYNLFVENVNYLNTAEEEVIMNRVYSDAKGISIDYGVMEKSEIVFVLETDFGWSDLGTWNSLYSLGEKDIDNNVCTVNQLIITKSTGNFIHSTSSNKIYIVQDINDLIVVDTEDALLICKRENEQEIAELFNEAKLKFGDKIK